MKLKKHETKMEKNKKRRKIIEKIKINEKRTIQ